MKKLGALLALLVALLAAACNAPVSREVLPDPQPGYDPPEESLEGGLWMRMEQYEEDVKTAGLRLRQPDLNDYVRDLVCRIAGPRCGDIRVYVLRIPAFNASMTPNGMLQIWSGLLLRAENEAQLTYVLAHEIAHYLRRHSLQLWHEQQSKTAFMAYLHLLGAITGVPAYGLDLTKLAAVGSLLQFSREAEREADELGFQLSTGAGYDPREAVTLWQALLAEREAADDPTPWLFFSTHPPTEERMATLAELAEGWVAKHGPGKLETERFLATLGPWRGEWLRDELRQRRYAATEVLLLRLLQQGYRSAELRYFQGELYRLRAEEGDAVRAEAAYAQALAGSDAPVSAYRGLALVQLKSGSPELALLNFRRYLEHAPDAEDRQIIRAHIQALE